ncbi:GH39 family glycosyl hydrolase [Actinomadura rupiterrae]|uniref:GH39 family glycosyl hydrolase n=1 Tax=Actinomadura rupiterrae TaxID=559627 RepID=UPI0020A2ED79|nr:hypothetical protein [Actinomadura rupiterrae]MCP2341734.1 xylan 1,4-beta-xylosidase [Actinomadura rupiterrae]
MTETNLSEPSGSEPAESDLAERAESELAERGESELAARARRDWTERIYRPSEAGRAAGVELSAPDGLTATPGAGHVTLSWDPLPDAIGYLAHRDGTPIEQKDVDVPAVPGTRYVHTGAEAGGAYTVAAIAGMGLVGPASAPVTAHPLPAAPAPPPVTVAVGADPVGEVARPWTPMIGSEHLSHLLSTATTGGRPIGAELTEALRVMRDELGVRTVRAHAILCDDLGVYREVDGEPVHDFGKVDEVYDIVTGLGMRPVVELSFMPRDLARDPSKTVFAYQAVISPPKDYDRWGALVEALVRHLVDRYGLDEVREHWSFEVWNEANLEVFWSGTADEFMRLYDVTAAAVKAVDPGLRVGGPSSAANGWMNELLEHVEASGAALDFVSTHTYGNAPLDWRPALARHGRPDLPVWWTEWGPTPTHFHGIGDGPFGAAFLLHGMRSAAGRIEALAHWVASDHFEELGRPPALFHGGFGLLTVGNLRKPRFWALALLDRLGPDELPVALSGDTGGVEAWASRAGDRFTVLVWNGTLNQAQADGDAVLAREVTVRCDLPSGAYTVRHLRVDDRHSDIRAAWRAMAGPDAAWPSDEQWQRLAEANTLDEYGPPAEVSGGTAEVTFTLPMPGVSFLEFTPR